MTVATPASRALLALLLCGAAVSAAPHSPSCEARALTQAGWVCGVHRCARAGVEYASFRGVPYAKQPLAELRFQELQPLEPWIDDLNATTEGPVCPQNDILYKGMQPHAAGMSEACIHANIHVPSDALPTRGVPTNATGLPILVFIHGGGFAFGSGDTDLHGPEYLVAKGVIVITFNYRLNVFGFLSLNSDSVPGNNGLRDCVTLLRWVRDNARAFGGDPDDVTLAGQSAGASMAHLLTLAPAAEGLFKRAVLLSGVANSEYFSTSPVFAKIAAGLFLDKLGISPALDPEEIHRQLVDTPLEALMTAHSALLEIFGLTVFVPVVESPHPGVTTVIDDDPDALLDRGRGSDIPLIVGFTSEECETFRPRLEAINIVGRIEATPALLVPPKLAYRAPRAAPAIVKLVERRYFEGNRNTTLDRFVKYCSESYYEADALQAGERRAPGGAPAFLLRFAYDGRSPVKEALGLDFKGAGHIEDLTYVFRAGAVLGALAPDAPPPPPRDQQIIDLMTDFIVNFMRYSDPTPHTHSWRAESGARALVLDVRAPHSARLRPLDARERDTLLFYADLHRLTTGPDRDNNK